MSKCLLFFGTLLALAAALPSSAQSAADWQSGVRERVERHDLTAAAAIVDQRLKDAPQDLEAVGWRARLHAWRGDWHAAESEYKLVLESSPDDVEILIGLSDVLAWQQRSAEALPLLNHACSLEPSNPDVLVHRARVLRSLGRPSEARQDFRAALRLDHQNKDAATGLASLSSELRHELRIGNDTDFFNYTDTAQAQTVSLRSQWTSRWATSFSGSSYQRYGEDAGKFMASVTRRLPGANALTVGGAIAHDQTVIPRCEAFFDFGHGWKLRRNSMIRAVETSYGQHWYWFSGARVLVFSPTAMLYLPGNTTWSFAVSPARSHFSNSAAGWQVSGVSRFSFPLQSRLTANLFYAVGSENFAQADQIGRFAARTIGGGSRLQLTSHQDITGFVASQDRSQARSAISIGFSYGIRF